MAFNIDFEIPEAKNNVGNAGLFWNRRKIDAKAGALASDILTQWGFAGLEPDQNPPIFEYNRRGNYFEGSGYRYNSKEVRDLVTEQGGSDLAGCSILGGIINDIMEDPNGLDEAQRRVNEAGAIGGKAKKNARIDRGKWKKVIRLFKSARTYQDELYQPCPIEVQEDGYLRGVSVLVDMLRNANKPMSNVTTTVLIGGVVAASAILLTKFIK